MCELVSSSSFSSDNSEDFSMQDSPLQGPSTSQRKQGRKRIIDERLALSPDVAKLRDRKQLCC